MFLSLLVEEVWGREGFLATIHFSLMKAFLGFGLGRLGEGVGHVLGKGREVMGVVRGAGVGEVRGDLDGLIVGAGGGEGGDGWRIASENGVTFLRNLLFRLVTLWDPSIFTK